MAEITISEHAYERANERLSLGRESFHRLAVKAFEQGVQHSDAKGKLKKYMDGLWFKFKNANNVRIYGENIFFFAGGTLVTVYQIPNDLKVYIKIIKHDKR